MNIQKAYLSVYSLGKKALAELSPEAEKIILNAADNSSALVAIQNPFKKAVLHPQLKEDVVILSKNNEFSKYKAKLSKELDAAKEKKLAAEIEKAKKEAAESLAKEQEIAAQAENTIQKCLTTNALSKDLSAIRQLFAKYTNTSRLKSIMNKYLDIVNREILRQEKRVQRTITNHYIDQKIDYKIKMESATKAINEYRRALSSGSAEKIAKAQSSASSALFDFKIAKKYFNKAEDLAKRSVPGFEAEKIAEPQELTAIYEYL